MGRHKKDVPKERVMHLAHYPYPMITPEERAQPEEDIYIEDCPACGNQFIREGSSNECPKCEKRQEAIRQIIIVGNEFKRGQMPGEEFEQAVKHYLGIRSKTCTQLKVIRVEKHTTADKSFTIIFPPTMDIDILIDFDDVNHEKVDREAVRIAQCLKDHLSEY